MTETAKQLRWIRNLYEELGFKLGPLHYASITKALYSLLPILLKKAVRSMFGWQNTSYENQWSLEKSNFTTFLQISNSLISSQRTWASRNSRKEESHFDFYDTNHRNISSEEECWESWYFIFSFCSWYQILEQSMTLSLRYSYYSPYQDKLSLIWWSRLMTSFLSLIMTSYAYQPIADTPLISYHTIQLWYQSSVSIRTNSTRYYIRWALQPISLSNYLVLSSYWFTPKLLAYTWTTSTLCHQHPEPVYVSLPLDNSSLCVPALSGLYSWNHDPSRLPRRCN